MAVSHNGVTLAPALGRLIAAERATKVLLDVESVFRDPARQDRST